MKTYPAVLLMCSLSIFGIACSQKVPNQVQPSPLTSTSMNSLILSSAAFQHNTTIPKQYTCEGKDINPPLEIKGIPDGTKSLTLIVDDPDAPVGMWDHWIIWNIPPHSTSIAEGEIPSGATQGINDFQKLSYGGPCPPPGKPHRYFFKLYALDEVLTIPEGSTKEALEEAITGHVLDKTELIGIYQR